MAASSAASTELLPMPPNFSARFGRRLAADGPDDGPDDGEAPPTPFDVEHLTVVSSSAATVVVADDLQPLVVVVDVGAFDGDEANAASATTGADFGAVTIVDEAAAAAAAAVAIFVGHLVPGKFVSSMAAFSSLADRSSSETLDSFDDIACGGEQRANCCFRVSIRGGPKEEVRTCCVTTEITHETNAHTHTLGMWERLASANQEREQHASEHVGLSRIAAN